MFPQYERILFSDVDVLFTADISSSFFLYPNEKFYYAGTRPIQENTNLPRYAKEFTQEEISGALRAHVIEGDIVPVMMGSGINCQGFKVSSGY